MDYDVKEKKDEENDKYMDLAAEVRSQFRVKIAIVIIVLGAFGQSQQNHQIRSKN